MDPTPPKEWGDGSPRPRRDQRRKQGQLRTARPLRYQSRHCSKTAETAETLNHPRLGTQRGILHAQRPPKASTGRRTGRLATPRTGGGEGGPRACQAKAKHKREADSPKSEDATQNTSRTKTHTHKQVLPHTQKKVLKTSFVSRKEEFPRGYPLTANVRNPYHDRDGAMDARVVNGGSKAANSQHPQERPPPPPRTTTVPRVKVQPHEGKYQHGNGSPNY